MNAPLVRPTPRLMGALLRSVWAITPEKLNQIATVLEAHQSGIRLKAVENDNPSVRSQGSVRVLPLYGLISHRANMLTEFSGGTSTEKFARYFREAVNDPSVSAIVIDTDSPGGTVDGVPELAAEIHAARGRKPIVAVANAQMASAAYWIGSAADEIVATPSGDLGSIGVLSLHQDESRMWDESGVTNTLFKAGRLKGAGNPYEPLDDEAKKIIQEQVDEFYGHFVSDVAKHRGVSAATVRDEFGEGFTVTAKKAVKLGMADRVETLDETIARLSRGNRRRTNAVAAMVSLTKIRASAMSARG